MTIVEPAVVLGISRATASDAVSRGEVPTAGATGGTIQSVEKTTLYLPEDLKARVKRAAAERGVSEAEIIRESIRASVGGVRPRARGALYSSAQPIARDAEEMLAGFGER